MVYITDEEGTVRKFACLTCIKGHRSSGCQHADRELVEIRKKGRPLTQCAHCRNLRKTKQVHIKCLCHKKSDVLSSLSPTTPPSVAAVTSATTATATATTTTTTATTTTTNTILPGPTASDNQHIDLMQQDLRVQNLLSKPCARCDRSPSYCICTFESRSNQVDYGYLSSGSSDGTVTPPITTTTTTTTSNFDLHHHNTISSPPSSSSSSSSPTPPNGHSLRLVIPSNNPTTESIHHRHATTTTAFEQHSESSSTASSRHGSPYTATHSFSSKASPSHRPQSISSPAGLHSIIPIHDPSDDLDSDTPVYKSEEQTIDQTDVLGELTNRTSEELMNQIYNEFSAETYKLSNPPLDFVTDDPEDDRPSMSRTLPLNHYHTTSSSASSPMQTSSPS